MANLKCFFPKADKILLSKDDKTWKALVICNTFFHQKIAIRLLGIIRDPSRGPFSIVSFVISKTVRMYARFESYMVLYIGENTGWHVINWTSASNIRYNGTRIPFHTEGPKLRHHAICKALQILFTGIKLISICNQCKTKVYNSCVEVLSLRKRKH